jgi:catechol O-methyltransferase
VNELVGKPVPFLRWSFLTMMLRRRYVLREWQVGTVGKRRWRNTSWPGPAPVTSTTLLSHRSLLPPRQLLINVGDEKGKILDNAVERTQPRRLLELGTYCGYSALRMARVMPREARLYSLEINTANAVIARRILAHAGVDDRVTVLVGTLGDGGETIRTLRRDCNFTPGSLDLVFLDHPNILVPGAPAYRAHMRDNDGTLWHTTEHRTHAEYQSVIKDVVLESDYLGT